MTDQVTDPSFDVRPSAEGHLAWLRARLAVERTFMAWLRTAVALIGFGFTIVQFFERLAHMAGVPPAAVPHAPRYLGVSLIGIGVFALLVSAWQYRTMVDYLWENFRVLGGVHRKPKQTPAMVAAIGLMLVGVFAFIAVLARAP